MFKSKYIERLFSGFPKNFAFTTDKNDPMFIFTNTISFFAGLLHKKQLDKADNLSIDRANPITPSGCYELSVTNPENIEFESIDDNPTLLKKTEAEFVENEFTGLEYVSTITPSGVMGSGIVGISFAYDADGSEFHLTFDGDYYIHNYYLNEEDYIDPSITFDNEPEHNETNIIEQKYENTGFDEYLHIVNELVTLVDSDDDDMSLVYAGPSGINSYLFDITQVYNVSETINDYIFVNDIWGPYKVVSAWSCNTNQWLLTLDAALDPHIIASTAFILKGYRKTAVLAHTPIENETVDVIDVLNLQTPGVDDASGRIVNIEDYRVVDDKIIFNLTRSDYNPDSVITVFNDNGLPTTTYSNTNYQPDESFSSTYICEYKYRLDGKPKYLTETVSRHNLCCKSTTVFST